MDRMGGMEAGNLVLMDYGQHLQCNDPGHGNAPGCSVPHGFQELAGAIQLSELMAERFLTSDTVTGSYGPLLVEDQA